MTMIAHIHKLVLTYILNLLYLNLHMLSNEVCYFVAIIEYQCTRNFITR